MTEQDARVPGNWSPLHRRLAARRLQEKGLSRAEPARTGLRGDVASNFGPLTFAQERLWFLQQFEKTDAPYRATSGTLITGPLKLAALFQALDGVGHRHPALRTIIVDTATSPMQQVCPPTTETGKLVDLGGLLAADRAALGRRLLDEETSHGFEPLNRPPIRLRVLRSSANGHLLAIAMHHIVADQWSLRLVQRELASLYAAYAGGLPFAVAAPTLGPIAVASQERAAFNWSRFEQRVQELSVRFADAGTELSIAEKGHRSGSELRAPAKSRAIPQSTARAVRRAAAGHGVTDFMYMLAAFELLLFRYTGQRRFLLGCPVSNRTREATVDVVGCLFNTLLFEASFDQDPTLAELIERVKADSKSNFEYQDLPFEKLVERIRPARSLRHSPLFDAMFMWTGSGQATLQLPDLDVEALEMPPPPSRFALTWAIGWTTHGYVVQVGYAADRASAPLIDRMLSHYLALLDVLPSASEQRASRVPFLLDHERHLLLEEWNATATAISELTVHELVDRRAALDGDRIAVLCEHEHVTYRELVRRARALAARLRAQGVNSESAVAVCLPRSARLAVALLGVLEAGACYVPLDSSLPPARLESMLRRANVTLLICDADFDEIARLSLGVRTLRPESQLEPSQPGRPGRPATPAQLAYVIYTSGSTGVPKAVGVLHRSVVNLLHAMADRLPLGRLDTLVSVTTVTFDIAALEIFLPWMIGGRVVIASEDQARDGERLATLLREVGAAAMQATPMTWRLLLAACPEGFHGLLALCGGEALSRPLADSLFRAAAEVWNLYGPTETTIWSTAARVQPGAGAPPIGRPLANSTAHVADGALGLAPVGVEGELYLGGAGLARGYLGDPAQTAARFVPDPFSEQPGARLYRTGDRVFRESDGQLAFVGRRDNQVKRRGFRIELEEIERALASVPGISECAVAAFAEREGDRPIVAYYVAEQRTVVSPPAIRRALLERIPEYMVPSGFVELSDLPRTTSGKVDRGALATSKPQFPVALHSTRPRRPTTSIEAQLAQIWADALGRPEIGTDDDFFELGGHSLLALRLVSRIRLELGSQLTVRELFTTRTVRNLAELLSNSTPGSTNLDPPPSEERDDHALSRAQLRLWIQEQSAEQRATYNTVGAFSLRGRLNSAALESAIDLLVARHEALRTRFDSDGYEPQRWVEPRANLRVEWRDLGALLGASKRAETLLLLEGQRAFDISRAPLLRVTCLRLSNDQFVVAFTVHHIVCDGWSIALLMREFGDLYEDALGGRPLSLGTPPASYGTFVSYERSWLSSPAAERALQAWLVALAAPRPVLDLVGDHPRPAKRGLGAAAFFEFGSALSTQVEAYCARQGLTVFTTLLSAVRVLLYRQTGQRETIIGSPFAGRLDPRFEPQVGLHVNTVPLRNELLQGATFDELTRSEQGVILHAFENQAYPFDLLLRKLEVTWDRRRFPLFDVWVELQNYGALGSLPTLTGLQVEPFIVEMPVSKFDLEFTFFQLQVGLCCRIRYKRDFHEASSIEAIGNALTKILARATAGAGETIEELCERAQGGANS